MIDEKLLLKHIKGDLPGASDKEIMQGIKEFDKENPGMSTLQALIVFRQAMKTPEVQAAKTGNTDQIGGFLQNQGQPVMPPQAPSAVPPQIQGGK